ncbi:MAG: hypothetical protein HC837_08585 [Chloroflexaceae bacterium]|nr:hypothetical protein [Chloroflexaceae bacterium]
MCMPILEIDFPDDVLTLPDQTIESLTTLARETLVVRLYQQGVLDVTRAAQILGLSPDEFHQTTQTHVSAPYRTPFGPRLAEFRTRVLDSGLPTLNWDSIAHEAVSPFRASVPPS